MVIKPLIKKPNLDPCELANYRPISNLPFMSNILETIVSAQLCSILQKNDIYEEFHSGFMPHHSTESALVKIANDLLLASDQSCILLLVLLDLSAAFNTIDHDILIDRLHNDTGIQGQTLRWFRSYLSDSYHFVYLNGFYELCRDDIGVLWKAPQAELRHNLVACRCWQASAWQTNAMQEVATFLPPQCKFANLGAHRDHWVHRCWR